MWMSVPLGFEAATYVRTYQNALNAARSNKEGEGGYCLGTIGLAEGVGHAVIVVDFAVVAAFPDLLLK